MSSTLHNPVKANWTMIGNELITDSRISAQAFRVACYLLSRPDGWVVFNKDIQKQLGIKSAQSLANHWKELINAGILFRRRKFTSDGKLNGGFEYAIWEKPAHWDEPPVSTKNRITEKPYYGKDVLQENRIHSNTDLSNTDSSNTEEERTYPTAKGGNAEKLHHDQFTEDQKKALSLSAQNPVLELFNEMVPELRVKSPNMLTLTAIQQRAADSFFNMEGWKAYFELVASSDFLTRRKGNSHLDFEWLMRKENIEKVRSGKYSDKVRATPMVGKLTPKGQKSMHAFSQFLAAGA